MNTFELVKELSEKPKEEIKFALITLMESGQIDFLDVNKAYIQCLENLKEDRLNQLVEAESCVMEGFLDSITKDKKDTPSGKRNYNHTQRCLYLLNQSGRFQMDNMNAKYSYDEEYGKKMSCYEREKEILKKW